ncbi:MAG TPA: uroporphyrinogen decarboxylase family protein [Terriglobales bacterium]|nr:uroporphyrinogen decarboxylase family protein [Terriglobales bacterium]
MAENPTPRQMAKDLLQGIAPPRPLFLPIVFSLGARVENLPLRSFLANPTKITNAMRQLRGPLPADGITCYFDPYLEVEALGAALRWHSDDQPPTVCWPGTPRKGELPQGLRPTEVAVTSGRIPIATEVIRRLDALLRDDTLLVAGLSGPFTLAASLLQISEQEWVDNNDVSSSALDLAAAMLTQTASAIVEAGAHVILIHEDVLPPLSDERVDDWANRLSPVVNIIRFYGALPLLLLTNPAAMCQNLELLANRAWEGILCPEASSFGEWPSIDAAKLGVALAPNYLPPDPALMKRIETLHPAVVTTSGDVPPSADVKQLAGMCEEVRRWR